MLHRYYFWSLLAVEVSKIPQQLSVLTERLRSLYCLTAWVSPSSAHKAQLRIYELCKLFFPKQVFWCFSDLWASHRVLNHIPLTTTTQEVNPPFWSCSEVTLYKICLKWDHCSGLFKQSKLSRAVPNSVVSSAGPQTEHIKLLSISMGLGKGEVAVKFNWSCP